MKLKKLIGRVLKSLLPLRIYKLLSNGSYIVPAYYKTIIKELENDLDLASHDSDEKNLLLMRKYGHIIDKGLHRQDATSGHSQRTYTLLRECLSRVKNSKYSEDPTVKWAESRVKLYEKLQHNPDFSPLRGKKPNEVVSFEEFENLVMARRSNRDFLPKKVADEDIQGLRKLANWASSSCNKQPINTYVTNDFNLAKKCLKCCKGGTGFSDVIPSFWVFTADVLGYVWPSEMYLPAIDTSLGIQNIMLGATCLGLSGTLLSWAQKSNQEEEQLRKLLNIPPHHQIIICAVLGYAKSYYDTPIRKGL